jgi:hypothetical protein
MDMFHFLFSKSKKIEKKLNMSIKICHIPQNDAATLMHNDTGHKYNWHCSTQHNETQYNGTHHNDIECCDVDDTGTPYYDTCHKDT